MAKRKRYTAQEKQALLERAFSALQDDVTLVRTDPGQEVVPDADTSSDDTMREFALFAKLMQERYGRGITVERVIAPGEASWEFMRAAWLLSRPTFTQNEPLYDLVLNYDLATSFVFMFLNDGWMSAGVMTFAEMLEDVQFVTAP